MFFCIAPRGKCRRACLTTLLNKKVRCTPPRRRVLASSMVCIDAVMPRKMIWNKHGCRPSLTQNIFPSDFGRLKSRHTDTRTSLVLPPWRHHGIDESKPCRKLTTVQGVGTLRQTRTVCRSLKETLGGEVKYPQFSSRKSVLTREVCKFSLVRRRNGGKRREEKMSTKSGLASAESCALLL